MYYTLSIRTFSCRIWISRIKGSSIGRISPSTHCDTSVSHLSGSSNRFHKRRVLNREAGLDSHLLLRQASSSNDRNKQQDWRGLQVQPSRAIHWKLSLCSSLGSGGVWKCHIVPTTNVTHQSTRQLTPITQEALSHMALLHQLFRTHFYTELISRLDNNLHGSPCIRRIVNLLKHFWVSNHVPDFYSGLRRKYIGLSFSHINIENSTFFSCHSSYSET